MDLRRKKLARTRQLMETFVMTGVTIDDIDHLLLDELERNARATLAEIGAAVGLSAPATKRRIDRLEAAGVIIGYTVRIDFTKVGRSIEAFTELRFAGSARVDVIAQIGDRVPEVRDVYTLTGDPDALVRIRVSSLEDLKRVVDILRGKGSIVGTKTMVVLGKSSAPGRSES
jgi:Lrp/AsnC family leucine-responsive transcriptional regulator